MLPVWLSKAPWRSAVIVTQISMHVTMTFPELTPV